ncbi:MAG: PQQ-binding-like beta-propeller repeat protein [Planctomycetota bacterium]
MDAALWLAGANLERADVAAAAAALTPLADHPDLADRAITYNELLGWTAALAGRSDEADAALSALRGLGEGERADSLARTFAGLHSPEGVGDDPARSARDTPPLVRALWEVQIIDAAESAQATAARNRNARLSGLGLGNLRPVAAESVLLFNDTLRVFALDRTSGRLRWVHRQTLPDLSDEADAQAVLQARRIALGRSLPDARRVLMCGRWAYAVVGNITAPRGQRRGQAIMPTELVCLDPETGRPRWTTTPGDLDESLARATFHGTPVACGDQIIVMARRSQASSFQDSYLMSVDADTGELRWRRHLASTAGATQRNAIVSLSRVTLDGQRLYFCDNLGAAASVDALTGTVHWVRVFAEAGDPRRRQASGLVLPTSEAARPTPSPAGLILPLRVAEAHALLLDPETGDIRRTFPADAPVARAHALLPLPGGDLLTTGRTYARLDGRTLEPRWSKPAPDGQTANAVPVAVVPERGVAVLSSTTRRFDELDLATGEVRKRHSVPWTGQVLALDHAWVVSDGPRVGSYLDWPIAYRELSRRAEDNPSSVVPGLSMATLALNAGRSDAMDEGINRALSALAQLPVGPDPAESEASPADARARVFRELLALTEKPKTVEPAIIESLFDRLAAITDTPAELVAYNLARGEFLEGQERLAEAADYYQAVLLDPRLADELWSRNQSTRRADLVARQRLLDMVDRHGRDFYENFETKAQQQFTALQLDPTTDAQDLRDLVRRYPLARVAAEATLAAADLQAKGPGHAGAAVQYRRAFQLAADDAVRARAAGALAGYYQDRGRPQAAIAWLTSFSRRHPDLQPLRDGLPRPADAWLNELRSIESQPTRAAGVSLPLGEARRLAGKLLRYEHPPSVPGSTDSVLVHTSSTPSPGRLVLHGVATDQVRWDVPAPEENLAVIQQGEDNIILWSRNQRKLFGLDTLTGKALWPAIQISPLLEELGEGGLASTRRANAGQIIKLIEADFGPVRRNQINPGLANRNVRTPRVVAGDAVVCVVDPGGRSVGIDRYTGRVLWQSALALDAVSHVAVGPGVLVVAGLAAPGKEAQASRVILLDQVTGRLRFPVVEDDEPVTWIQLAPEHGLVVASQGRLTLLDADNGSTRWRIDLAAEAGNRRWVIAQDSVYAVDNAGLMGFDLTTGDRREAPGLLNRNAQLLAHGNELVGLFTEGAAANTCGKIGPELDFRWRDAIELPNKRFVRFTLDGGHVFVVHLDRLLERGRLNLFALELDTGRLVAQRSFTRLLPNPMPTELRVLDNHLLLGGREWVLLVPGAEPADLEGTHTANPPPIPVRGP